MTRSGRASNLCASFAALVSLSAFGGAVGLVGGWLTLGDEVTSRLPFESPVFGGVALALSVGVPFAVLASQALRGDRRMAQSAMGASALLMLWLVVEIAFIRELSFFHPLYALIAVAFFRFGLHHARDGQSIAVGSNGEPAMPW